MRCPAALYWVVSALLPPLGLAQTMPGQIDNPVWQTLGSDLTATNTIASRSDSLSGAPQRFYRIQLVN
jgi:hypothetical protein